MILQIESSTLKSIITEAYIEGGAKVMSLITKPRIKEYLSERESITILAKAGLDQFYLRKWILEGKLPCHRGGDKKNSPKKIDRIRLETLIEKQLKG